MDERVQKYEQKMTKTLNGFEEELTTIRAGRANPHILDKIRAELAEKGINAKIQAKHLYHDREEITVHIQNIWAAYRPDREF